MKLSIDQLLTVAGMFLFAGSPVLADTTPGSPRSIIVAISGVLLALGVLFRAALPNATRATSMVARVPLVTRPQLRLIVLFTLVELVTLTLWFRLFSSLLLAAAVLFVGLLVEHTIATIAGNSYNNPESFLEQLQPQFQQWGDRFDRFLEILDGKETSDSKRSS